MDWSVSPENVRGTKPEWSLPKIKVMNRWGSYLTEKSTSYGQFGHNPLKLTETMTKYSLSNACDLNGTTKVTANPPGYTGFIPKYEGNDLAI